MADSTTVTDFNIGHWFDVATITNVVTATKTFGIKVSNAFKDKTATVITGNFFMNVLDPSNNKVERIFVPASGVSADGLTIGVETTGEVTRGLKPTGNDTSDGSSTYSFKLKPGMIVAATVDPIILTEWQKFILGTIGSGARNLKIGDGTSNATQGFQIDQGISGSVLKYGADASGNPLITLPGGSSFIPGAAAGSITGGDGIDFTASVVSVDVADTSIFVKTSSGAGDENKVPIAGAAGTIASGFIPTLNQNTTGTAANLSGTPALPNGVTATTQAVNDNSTKLATTAYVDRTNHKVVNGTISATATSSTTDITGIGFTPTSVQIVAQATGSAESGMSTGSSDGTNNGCVRTYGTTATQYFHDATKSMYVVWDEGAGDLTFQATIGSFSAANGGQLTVTWTGTATETINYTMHIFG